eukprot:13545539-Heterocapsa_arctica.AAC.1
MLRVPQRPPAVAGLAEDRVADAHGEAADAPGEALGRDGLDDELVHAERVPDADEMEDMDDK